MILGKKCTRRCGFCSAGRDEDLFREPDKNEPFRILEAVRRLGVKRVVITSVTRDDLEDGGAGHFADCVDILKRYDGSLDVEVLVPDFRGDRDSVKKVILSGPDTFSHNVETVPRLYVDVRPDSDYNRSLDVLRYVKKRAPYMDIKSGMMVGFGEKEKEVRLVMKDLRSAGCDIITIGQYLKPGKGCLEVKDFLHPDKFRRFSNWAGELGFKKHSCSPLTRSSYLE
jgi:lipoyl synthase